MRVIMRAYFSGYLLWTAQHQAELAGQIEQAHHGRDRFSIEHRGYVLSSIVASVGFLEAMVNELYQDAADGHVASDGYVTPLSADCRRLMSELWRTTNEGTRLSALNKYEMLLAFGAAPRMNRGAQPYQDASLAIRLRNAIVHFRPESLSAEDEAHALESRLKGKFAENPLMTGSRRDPWWPDHALGYGCADWAHRAVKAFTAHVSDALAIEPNYRRLEGREGFWHTPGERELDNTDDRPSDA